ncbi:MAG TPA: GDP-mannose 4,6-dehydratase, partial [Hyphomicrobium sp.]|nr:GDP-mannose 4,6-dehydratase [Hyphomicrobium sp.]
SPYSASKAASDHLVRAWHETYGLPVIITNCSNNYGPYQYPEKFIPTVILSAVNGHAIPIYGDGRHIRDWLHVDDHVRALAAALRFGEVGDSYVIGGRAPMENMAVALKICDVLDRFCPAARSYRTLIRHVTDRPGHDRCYVIDPSKIENDLGWTALESFETGIEKTVLWYLERYDARPTARHRRIFQATSIGAPAAYSSHAPIV